MNGKSRQFSVTCLASRKITGKNFSLPRASVTCFTFDQICLMYGVDRLQYYDV